MRSGTPARVRVTGGAAGVTFDDQFEAVAGEAMWKTSDLRGRPTATTSPAPSVRDVVVDTLRPRPEPGPWLLAASCSPSSWVHQRAQAAGDQRWRELLDAQTRRPGGWSAARAGGGSRAPATASSAIFDGRPGHPLRHGPPRTELRTASASRSGPAGPHRELDVRDDDVGGSPSTSGAGIMAAPARVRFPGRPRPSTWRRHQPRHRGTRRRGPDHRSPQVRSACRGPPEPADVSRSPSGIPWEFDL